MELYHADYIKELVPVFVGANFAETVYQGTFQMLLVEAEIISMVSRFLLFWTCSIRVLAS
jgi:hypothetical protein